jgi:magnesium transporter
MSRRNRARLSRRLRVRRGKSRPGAAPEASLHPSHVEGPRPAIEVFAFNQADVVNHSVANVKEIEPLRAKYPLVWVNVVGLGDADVIRDLGKLFNLHPLALEDVVHAHQRSKVDAYDSSLYIVVREVEQAEPFETDQVSLFLSDGFVLTFQERPRDNFDAIRNQLKQAGSFLRQNCHADYLAYRLIDAVVDGYFPVLERIGDQLDELDEQVANHPSPAVFTKVHQLRGDLLLLRRAVWPHREAVNQLIRDPNPRIGDHTRTYLRDVYDHTTQLIDLAETYREICSDMRDFYMSSVGVRMNEIMKVLTIIATIFMPLSFIAGIWGMNFNTEASPLNMPELNWYYGYPMALGVMIAVAAMMMYFFYRRRWLRRQDRGAEPKDAE